MHLILDTLYIRFVNFPVYMNNATIVWMSL